MPFSRFRQDFERELYRRGVVELMLAERFEIAMEPYRREAVERYAKKNNLTDAEAGRIAYRRLLKAPPTKAERESAKSQRGNPDWKSKAK